MISGVVTDTHVESAMPTAHARLAAKLTLTRDGKAACGKTLGVETQRAPNLVGAVAIPDAINRYTALFQTLAVALFADPDVQAAASTRYIAADVPAMKPPPSTRVDSAGS